MSFNQMYNEEQQQMLFEKVRQKSGFLKWRNHLEETEQLFNDALSWGISEA